MCNTALQCQKLLELFELLIKRANIVGGLHGFVSASSCTTCSANGRALTVDKLKSVQLLADYIYVYVRTHSIKDKRLIIFLIAILVIHQQLTAHNLVWRFIFLSVGRLSRIETFVATCEGHQRKKSAPIH